MTTDRFSMKGWDIKAFLKGRKQLIITALGYIGSMIITRDPALSAIVAAGTELIGSVIDYYIKKG